MCALTNRTQLVASPPMRLAMFVASVVVIIGSLGTPGTITGIGATMPVWDAHHTADVHCPKPSQPKYGCSTGYDRNPSLPNQVCDHDEFCSVEVPNPADGIVWDYSMQFPSGTDLAASQAACPDPASS